MRDVVAGALLAWAWPKSTGTGSSTSIRPHHGNRINYRGRTVSLSGGPALSVAATISAVAGASRRGESRLAAAALVAGGVAGAVGRYDDLVGAAPGQQAKGLAGHFRALRTGRLTTGVVKLVGLSVAGLVAAALVESGRAESGRVESGRVESGHAESGRHVAADEGRVAAGDGSGGLRRAAEVLTGAGVIAGAANLINLLDLRPGRALKAGVLLGAPLLRCRTDRGAGGLVVAGPVGAAIALLPADLSEQSMLGDCGANSLGALLGLGLVARTGLGGRTTLLAGLIALTAASERVSFSRVIEQTPPLRRLDRLGRRQER